MAKAKNPYFDMAGQLFRFFSYALPATGSGVMGLYFLHGATITDGATRFAMAAIGLALLGFVAVIDRHAKRTHGSIAVKAPKGEMKIGWLNVMKLPRFFVYAGSATVAFLGSAGLAISLAGAGFAVAAAVMAAVAITSPFVLQAVAEKRGGSLACV